MANLRTELWIPILIGDEEEFFKNDRFLSHGKNQSAFVLNDVLHFAYKGGRPGVTKNFKTDGTTELPVFLRTDVPDQITLDDYSTDQVVLPFDENLLLPYDKKQSLLEDARMALVEAIASEGLWDVGPQVSATKTPVFEIATGNAVSTEDSYKIITRAEFTKMRIKMDIQYPGWAKKTWFCVMDVTAYWELINSDVILQEQFKRVLTPSERGAITAHDLPVLNIEGFNIYPDNRTAWYDNITKAKLAFGSTPTVGTHYKSALIYMADETFITALGSTELFNQDRNPGKQADLTSFRTRAYVGPWGVTAANLKHAGAILRTP